MRKNIVTLAALLSLYGMTSSGCAGLFLWERGHYYHSEAMDSAAVAAKDVRTVGVYTFSDGESVDHGMTDGLNLSDWPSQIDKDSKFDPDTSLAGPSLELSNNLANLLNEKGYNAKAITDIGHNGEVTVEQCMKHAKEHSYDGALIVYYKGVKNWKESNSSIFAALSGRISLTAAALTAHQGFLYIPNAAFYETKTGDQLWRSSYYGLVENAHLPNLGNAPFVKVVENSFADNDEETYIKSAPKAAKSLLEPELFPTTRKAFPSKGEKKHRM